VVGESGAGKSTIMKLLFRFYDPTEGGIFINGQDIRELSQHSLRSHIGIVPQDTVLFNTSLVENIRYGNPDASDEEVTHAIKLAHLTQFVESLPDGLDTTVGERGLKLSGGEKQRVAIARALLKGAPIMIFDEATSSLDSQSEQAILGALRDAAKGHTSLVIAHRLSTIVDADTILVLSKGMIAEHGTHETLLAQQGIYNRLWATQQRDSNHEEMGQ
jgi:ATP-binding cassette subfamily B protein